MNRFGPIACPVEDEETLTRPCQEPDRGPAIRIGGPRSHTGLHMTFWNPAGPLFIDVSTLGSGYKGVFQLVRPLGTSD